MQYYTLREIDDWLRQARARDYLKWGDWHQLANKIKKQDAEGTGPARLTELLALTTELKKLFMPGCPVSKQAVRAACDRWLRGRKLYFKVQTHDIAHGNTLLAPTTGVKFYDMAFYHEDAPNYASGHHKGRVPCFKENLLPHSRARLPQIAAAAGETTPGALEDLLTEFLTQTQIEKRLNSLFYLRVENFNKNMLIGNMQIDDLSLDCDDQPPPLSPILYTKRNIYAHMVQQALKTAVAAGVKKIYFQAGHAAELSQWDDDDTIRNRELITPANLPAYEKIYAEQLKELGAIKIGDEELYAPKHAPELTRGVVVKKTAQAVYTRPRDGGLVLPYVLSTAPYFNGYRPEINEQTILPDFTKIISCNLEDTLRTIVNCASAEIGIDAKNCRYDLLDIQPILREIDESRPEKPAPALIHATHRSLYLDLKIAYAAGDAQKMLHALERIFVYVVPPVAPTATSEKLAALQALCAAKPETFKTSGKPVPQMMAVPDDNLGMITKPPVKLYELLQPFLIEFKYHERLQKHIPGTAVLKLPNDMIFLNHVKENRWTQVNIAQKPILHEMAPKAAQARRQHDYAPHLAHRESAIFNLYQVTLPKIFKKLNLRFKKVLLSPWLNQDTMKTPVWEILTPPAELAQRDFRVF